MTSHRNHLTNSQQSEPTTIRSVFRQWFPLAISWLFMTAEFVIVNALIARLPDEKFNLAAFGVTIALVMLCESPVFALVSAANALAVDGESFRRLRLAAFSLSFALCGVLGVICTEWGACLVLEEILGIDHEISGLARAALTTMILTPLLVGYRRFYQGILLGFGKSVPVAIGTAIRLTVFTSSGFVLSHLNIPGALVASLAFMAGMTAEAVASRLFVKPYLLQLKARTERSNLFFRDIAMFYYPLAITSVVLISVHPMTSFFLARGRLALESLAVFPVVSALVLIFKSAGIALQEVTVSVLVRENESERIVSRFATILASIISVFLLGAALTPLSWWWFEAIAGLPHDLIPVASSALLLMALLPGLSAWSGYQRGVLISARATRAISYASMIEVVTIFGGLSILIRAFDLVGAYAAALSVVVGGIISNLYLLRVRTKKSRESCFSIN